MNPFFDLDVGEKPPDEVNMIVEIPTGCMNKYEFDKEVGLLKLDRVNYSDMPYPVEYGLVPRTWYDDNDPLDIFTFVSWPTFPGCVLSVRPIGLMKMNDDGEVDDKIVSVPVDDKRFEEVQTLDDIPPHKIKAIEFFFETYKALKKDGGVVTKVEGWYGKDEAIKAIKHGIELFKEKYPKK